MVHLWAIMKSNFCHSNNTRKYKRYQTSQQPGRKTPRRLKAKLSVKLMNVSYGTRKTGILKKNLLINRAKLTVTHQGL